MLISALRRRVGVGSGGTGRKAAVSCAAAACRPLIVRPDAPDSTSPLKVPVHECYSPSLVFASMQRRGYSTPPRELPVQKPGKRRVKKRSVLDLSEKYKKGERLTMLTCYDYPTAVAVEEAGVDMVLVGDSVGMVVHGHEDTLPVTVDDIAAHTRAVRRGARNTFIISDMPFGSFEVDEVAAVANAVRLVKEGGADAVKLEGGARMASKAQAITKAGILVQGHIGLTPQTAAAMGGFKVQGKSADAVKKLLEDAKALEAAGCFSIVIEAVPPEAAEFITKQLSIPTIGIGAGSGTSGQVLVLHDMIGLNPGRVPKFCKKYADALQLVREAASSYVADVRSGSFPTPDYSYSMPPAEAAKLQPAPAYARRTVSPHRKIAVIGGGAMGSFVGGSLARQGDNKVWLVSDWSEHVETITSKGLRLDTLDGASSCSINALSATSNIEDIIKESGYMDMCIILVKSPNTAIAARKAAQLLDPHNGQIVTLQNGVGNRESILSVFDNPDRVVQGITAHGAMLLGEGHVQHTGIGTTTLALPGSGSGIRERVADIARVLTLAGIDTGIGENTAMEGVVWGKLIVNAAINPLTAIYRVQNGVIAEHPKCRELLKKTVNEAANVASSKGIRLPFQDPVAQALAVARLTSTNRSSMLCDVLRGVRTEIDAINGAVVREGLRLGVCVDTNEELIDMVETGRQLQVA